METETAGFQCGDDHFMSTITTPVLSYRQELSTAIQCHIPAGKPTTNVDKLNR